MDCPRSWRRVANEGAVGDVSDDNGVLAAQQCWLDPSTTTIEPGAVVNEETVLDLGKDVDDRRILAASSLVYATAISGGVIRDEPATINRVAINAIYVHTTTVVQKRASLKDVIVLKEASFDHSRCLITDIDSSAVASRLVVLEDASFDHGRGISLDVDTGTPTIRFVVSNDAVDQLQ
jgi:hypothetical protein